MGQTSEIDLKVDKVRVARFVRSDFSVKFGSITCPTFTETGGSTRLCNTDFF